MPYVLSYVNARFEVRAKLLRRAMNSAMVAKGWKVRLDAAIDAAVAKGQTLTGIAAKVKGRLPPGAKGPTGRNFVSQIRNNPDANPTLATLVALADELELSLAYLFTGIEMTKANERAYRQFLMVREKNPLLLAELLSRYAADPEEGTSNTSETDDRS